MYITKLHLRYRIQWRRAIGCVAVAAGLIYLWQAINVWQTQEAEAQADDSSRTTSLMVAWSQPRRVELMGTGAAIGESGYLRFSPDDPIAVMRISALPALPFGASYQLWCYDGSGKVDPSTSFTVPVDNDDIILVMVSTPRQFSVYNHFAITAEPSTHSKQPSSIVVMSN